MNFSALIDISILVKKSNFTLVFLKAACHSNPGALKNEQDQVHIFQDTYFKSSQIHLLTIITILSL